MATPTPAPSSASSPRPRPRTKRPRRSPTNRSKMHDAAAASMRGRKIGFVGGGNMAAALIRGLLQSSTVTADQIRASDVNDDRLGGLREKYGIETTTDNDELTRWADVIVIAVKPQIVDRILG